MQICTVRQVVRHLGRIKHGGRVSWEGMERQTDRQCKAAEIKGMVGRQTRMQGKVV